MATVSGEGREALEFPSRIIAESLLNLLSCVHDEGAVLNYGLVIGSPRNDDEPAAIGAGGDADGFAIAQNRASAVLARLLILADTHGALQHVHERVVVGGDVLLEGGVGLHVHVPVHGWRGREHWGLRAEALASDDLDGHSAIVVGGGGDLVGGDLLVLGLGHFVLGGEVDPELEPHVGAVAGGHLRVHDAAAGGHPLHVAHADSALVALVVLVLERAL